MSDWDWHRGGVVGSVDRLSRGVNGTFAVFAAVPLLGIMLLTVANLLLRMAGAPIAGAFELVGWLAALANGLAVGYTQTKGGHVNIDVLTRLLPRRAESVLAVVITAVSAAFFTVVTWRLVSHAFGLRDVGSVSDVLRIPYYPFTLIVAVGFAGLVLALLADLAREGRKVVGSSRGSSGEDPPPPAGGDDDGGGR